MRGTLVIVVVAAAACTPQLAGLCSTSADCKQDESCSADGICLKTQGSLNGDGGNSDAGDAGNSDAGTTPASTIDLLTPQSGATLAGHFHVSAQSDSAASVTGVDFVVTRAADDGALGQVSAGTPSGTVWSADVTLGDGSFGGGAKVKPVMHRSGLADVTGSAVSVLVDQAAPSIVGWDAGGWWARDAGVVVTATIADDRSGVASAALSLPDGGTYAGTLAGTTGVTATIQLPAADVIPAGQAAAVPFSLAATDLVGNRAALPDASVLMIDDAPPSIGLIPPDPSVWHSSAVDVAAVVGDQGAGLASVALVIGGVSVAGEADAGGVFVFHADVPAATEAAVPVQIVAEDLVHNAADAGFSLLVDDVPPSVAPQIGTPPDFVDGLGRRWYQGRPAGSITVTAEIDGGSGSPIAGATATWTGGSAPSAGPVYSFDIPRALGVGTEGVQSPDIQAQDVAGNAGDATVDILFDGIAPSVSADSTNPDDTAWHSTRAGTLTFAASAVILDLGSGVASATLGPVSGSMGAGSVWSFPSLQLPSTATLENLAYPVALTVKDNVGNETDTTISFAVDNNPPSVSGAQIDSAFDGTDSGSQGWFQGPTACPTCGAVQVSAVITDAYLVGSSVVANVGASSYSGTLVSGRWQFSIPRSVGLNASSPVAVTFDAQDQAGNHPVSPPGLSLQFDDVPGSTFKPSVASDSAWYGRSASVSPSIAVTLPALPRSGVASVKLSVAGKTDVTCSKNSSTSYTCALPSTYAAAATEAALSFSVTAASASGIAPSTAGSRNIDDVAPVVSAVTFGYPPGRSSLTLRDSIPCSGGGCTSPATVFTAWDCGAGVSTAGSSMSFSPALATSGLSVADSGARHACSNGNSAVIYNFNASASLGTSAAGSFGAIGNTLTLTATAVDAASAQSHSSQKTQGISVTRLLWTASPVTASGVNLSSLAFGPRLFAGGSAGLYAWDPITAAQTAWVTSSVDLVGIAPNGGVPAVIYAASFSVTAGNASAGAGNYGSCFTTGVDDFGPIALGGASSAVIASDTVTSASGCVCTCCTGDGFACNTPACYVIDGCGCTPHYTNYTNMLTLSGSSVSCSAGGSAASAVCNGTPAPGLAFAVSSGSPALYVGANGTSTWVAETTGGAVLNSWGGTIAAGHGWPLIDGSSPPIAYLPDVAGGGIDAVRLGAGGFGARLYSLSPPFGGTVTDMTLGANGILYVLSANSIYAIQTDSTGKLANQAGAWPAACHDPCRSSIAGFSCPY